MNKMGFGYLRLPKIEGTDAIDYPLLSQMADEFIAAGGRYFDTAYTYLDGESEIALRETVVRRYPRESFIIANKIAPWKMKTAQDAPRMFAEMLQRCGVDYFDVLLLHGLNDENYEIALKFGMFDFVRAQKAEGKARAIGFSFHDSADVLERILSEQPDMEYVQLQINYLDWESPSLQAQKLYETAAKHGKTIVVMEPVKGGTLASLPEGAAELLPKGESPSSFALRFAQGLEQVSIVLSGMNTMAQIRENMRPVQPLSAQEEAKLLAAAQAVRANTAVGCTACGYCEAGCPKNIAIPQYFAMYNEYRRSPKDDWKIQPVYQSVAKTRGKASDCIGCKKCERVCPQKIEITKFLAETVKAFE